MGMGTLIFRRFVPAALLALFIGGLVVGVLKYRDLSARTRRTQVELAAAESSLQGVQATLTTLVSASQGADYASSGDVAELSDRLDSLESDLQDIEVGPNLSLDVAALQARIRSIQSCQRDLISALSLGRDPRYIFC